MEAAMASGVRAWELCEDGSWARSGNLDSQAERMREVGELAG
jgi:hypothetical protein